LMDRLQPVVPIANAVIAAHRKFFKVSYTPPDICSDASS
jgi:hypothetical protein